MTGFVQLGARSTLQDVINARRNDAAVVSYILGNKVQGRDRTGLRDLPADETETLPGDIVGDYFYDVANAYRYELIDDNGTIQWVRIAIVTTFTNP